MSDFLSEMLPCDVTPPARLTTSQEAVTARGGYTVYKAAHEYGFQDGTNLRTIVCDEKGKWHTKWQVRRKFFSYTPGSAGW